MPNVALTEFLPGTLRGVPNAARPVALEMIRQAANELLIRTQLWQATLSPVALVAGTNEYTLVPPAGTQIIELLERVVVDTYYFEPTTREALFRESLSWETDTGDKIIGGYLSGVNTLRVAPTPNIAAAGDLMVVRAALSLTPTATEVVQEAYLYEECRLAIEHGARKRLFLEPNTDWFSPDQAKYDALEASRYTTYADNRVRKNRTNRDLHVQMVTFGR